MHIYLRILYIFLCINPLQEQFLYIKQFQEICFFPNFSSKEENLSENLLNVEKKSNPSNV